MSENKQGRKKLPPPLIFRPCPAKLSPRTLAHANNERQFIILGITSSPHGSRSSIQISFEYVCLHIGFGLGSDALDGSIIWRDLDITLFYYGIVVAVAVSVFSVCASHVPPHQAPDLSRNISSRRRNISRSIAIADTATVTTHQAPHRRSRRSRRSRSRSRRNTSRSIAIADTATATVTTHQASPHRTTRNTSRSIAIANTATVTTHQASPHRTTRNTSRSIAIADTAIIVVIPHQAPDRRRRRRNTPRSIAIADTATVTPHQAPDLSRNISSRRRNISRSIAIGNTAIVTTHQAPHRIIIIRRRSSRSRRNTSRSIAIADTATVTTHQAPHKRRIIIIRRRNTSRSIAIGNTATVTTRQAPDIRRRSRRRNISRSIAFINSPKVAACQNTLFGNRSACCVHAKVFDNSSFSQTSKKAWIIVSIKIIYAKVSSVERTGEISIGVP